MLTLKDDTRGNTNSSSISKYGSVTTSMCREHATVCTSHKSTVVLSAPKRLSKHKFMWNQKQIFDLEHQFVNNQHYLKQFTYNEQFRINGFQRLPLQITNTNSRSTGEQQTGHHKQFSSLRFTHLGYHEKKRYSKVLYTHVNTVWKGCTGMATV